jgi:hypothetical protein
MNGELASECPWKAMHPAAFEVICFNPRRLCSFAPLRWFGAAFRIGRKGSGHCLSGMISLASERHFAFNLALLSVGATCLTFIRAKHF